jgi:poly-gamma-glutamate synthase PgsB/CapB
MTTTLTLVLTLVLVALCCYGIWEYHGHQRRLRRIPLRIHVNGSRGKSSVTRLIAAGLRAGGIRTLAKTTGTLPRIIDHEGREIAIVREQRANVIEQVKIIRFMDKHHPQAIVIECMAVLPEYQWLCERQLIRSQIGVITNARLDHINEMGRFREQITHSLANTCPKNGVLYTSEKCNFEILAEAARKMNSQIFRVGGQGVTADDMRGFAYIEHPANVGLALAVCEQAGVERKTALNGMYTTIPDAGALRVARCIKYESASFVDDKKRKVGEGRELFFINAMAANDPESTLEIWKQVSVLFAPLETVIVLLNSRADRQDRSMQLIEMLVGSIQFDKVVLTGENPIKFEQYLLKNKVPADKIIALGWHKPEVVYNKLFSLVEHQGIVMGIGNVGAGGLDIFRYFYKHRAFPVVVVCPHCRKSLMNEEFLFDGFPSISLKMLFNDRWIWLRLSSVYGSYDLEMESEVPANEVVKMFCPSCNTELISDKLCSECGIMMVPVSIREGGTVYTCPRRGCKGHLIENA